MDYQVMPYLTSDEYETLKEDIAERGVMIPIEFDENGNVLDGHHRLKACVELGITDFPKIIREGMTEEEKWTHARKLNMTRRHLTQEQRRRLIQNQILDTPEVSDRQIAKMLGVSNSTVSILRRELMNRGQVCESHTYSGPDGEEYFRNRELAKKYAFFTRKDIEQLQNYINLETDADKLKKLLSVLKEENIIVLETLLEIESKINELRNL
jgi:transposase